MESSPVRTALLIRALAALGSVVALACGTERSDIEAPNPTRDSPNPIVLRSPTDAWVAAGESTYYRSEYDSARAIFRQAIAMAETARDSAPLARALTWLGLTEWRRSSYADARAIGERALQLKLRLGMSGEIAKSYNALGLLAWNEGRYGDAIALYGHAVADARSAGDEVLVGKALGNLGIVHENVGEFARAREGFEGMRIRMQAAGDRRAEGNSLANLGMVEIRLGDPRVAIDRLTEARQLYREVAWATGEENAVGQLASAYDALGETQRAFAYADSALALARKHGLRQQEVDDLQLVAGMYHQAGDDQRALEQLAAARLIAQDVGLTEDLAEIAREEADVLGALGRIAEAEERATTAVRVHRELGAKSEEVADQLLIAELAHRSAAAPRATAALGSAARLASAFAPGGVRLGVHLTAARIAERDGQPDSVLRTLARADSMLPMVGPGVAWEVHALRARALAEVGKLDEAIVEGRTAVSLLERVRGGLGNSPLRATLTAARSNVYADLVLILLRRGRTDEALEIADAARGRALLEHLSAAGIGLRANARAVGSLANAEDLLRRIDALLELIAEADTVRSRTRSPAPDASSSSLIGRLNAARHEYEELLTRAASAEPVTMKLLGAVRTSAADVRSALGVDEVLLEYLITPERLLTFVVTRNAVRVLDTAVTGEAIASRVRLARDLLGDHAAGAAPPVLATLYDLLVAPAERAGMLGDAKTLIIVPHGPLSYLPFAALRDRRRGTFLVERYATLVLPSGGAIAALRDKPTRARASRWMRVSAFAPFPDRLPGTTAEVMAVARAGGGRPMVGATATERSIRRALTRRQILHVATHGALNPRNPMFSRIELARPKGSAPDDDGRLELHELLGLSIASPLVFLSGCETALGTAWSTDFARGEDYSTLAQAFLQGGTRNVVATLWRIEDRGAAVMAERFYRALRGRSPVDALAHAQRQMLRDRSYSSTYYWAAYQLSGDGLRH